MKSQLPDHLKALMASNPLFIDGMHWPEGHTDFRGLTWPNDFRAGIYENLKTPGQFKMLFGNREDAESCAGTLRRAGLTPRIIPPHGEQMECDGEDMGTTLVHCFALVWGA